MHKRMQKKLSRCPTVSPKNALQKNYFLKKYFVSLARPCYRTSSGRPWTWEKGMAAQKKLKKREKRAVLCLSCSLFIRWVSAGLATTATTAAAATATATFIDWINLAVPPITITAEIA